MNEILDALKNDHRDFDSNKLEEVYGIEPFHLFEEWFENAVKTNQPEVNAFSLATVSPDGQPTNRILYLKEMIEKSFVFYTNYNSDKGSHLAANPKASIQFFWHGLHQQIRIEGTCEKVADEMSNEYFASRPRGSQVGAWASSQSEEVASRDALEDRVKEFDAKYPNDVPRPPHWGGYRLTPTRFEFWQGRPSRLHDRIVFERQGNEWKLFRINP